MKPWVKQEGTQLQPGVHSFGRLVSTRSKRYGWPLRAQFTKNNTVLRLECMCVCVCWTHFHEANLGQRCSYSWLNSTHRATGEANVLVARVSKTSTSVKPSRLSVWVIFTEADKVEKDMGVLPLSGFCLCYQACVPRWQSVGASPFARICIVLTTESSSHRGILGQAPCNKWCKHTPVKCVHTHTQPEFS